MRAMLRAVGESSITAGLIILLFCAYLLWGTGAYTEDQQLLLQRQLAEERPAGTPLLGKIQLGKAVAMLRIPRLGRDYRYAVIEGVSTEDLKKGPGHYPGSAQPGQIGNFVISGHRTTYAAPFKRIGELRPGDKIIADAHDARYTYRVTRQEIVQPDAVEVIAPVPGKPGARPSRAVITLTTCHPEYSAAQRLIVHGVLKRLELRKD